MLFGIFVGGGLAMGLSLGAGILSPIALGELLTPVRYSRPTNVGEF